MNEKETTKVVNMTNGKVTEKYITTTKRNSYSKYVRCTMCSYLIIAVLCSFVFAYYSGKYCLMDYRDHDNLFKNTYSTNCRTSEFRRIHSDESAVLEGIRSNSYGNTWRSIWWPFNLANSVTTYLVLKLN